jgi:hypothetical protein
MMIFTNLTPHRSLSNLSDIIRWSIDFRWMSADAPDCYWGLKDPVRMRSSTDSNFQIDWDSFDAVDRVVKQFEAMKQEVDEFDTTVQAPFMHKWEMVHKNRHTAGLAKTANVNWDNLPPSLAG